MPPYFLLLSFEGKTFNFSNHSKNKKKKNDYFEIPDNFKILVIDDDEDFLRALSFRLKNKKINVHCVDSGYIAITELKNNCFDLILLDLRMPGMNGAETFKKITEIPGEHFVIIMTAYPEEEQMKIISTLGPFGMLNKPFELRQLFPYIKKRIQEVNNDKGENSDN